MFLMRTKTITSLALPGYHESRKAIFSDKRKPAEKKEKKKPQVLAVFQNSGGSGWWSTLDGGGPKPPLTSAPMTSVAGHSSRTFKNI